MAFSRDGSYSIASALNEAIAIGDWKFYTTYNEKITTVTADNIKEVANKYLNENKGPPGILRLKAKVLLMEICLDPPKYTSR